MRSAAPKGTPSAAAPPDCVEAARCLRRLRFLLVFCARRAARTVRPDGAAAAAVRWGVQAASSDGRLLTLILPSKPLGSGGEGHVPWLLPTRGSRMKRMDVANAVPIGGCARATAEALDAALISEKCPRC